MCIHIAFINNTDIHVADPNLLFAQAAAACEPID
jgi:hypothetical protein